MVLGEMRADSNQVLAFRLDGQHLSRRLPLEGLHEAAGACSIQNTPPGAAVLSLHARVDGVTPSEIERHLQVDKTLLQAWTLRGSPHLFPTRDAPVFTLGMLPVDETAIRFFIRGARPALDQAGISAGALVAFTSAALDQELDHCALTKDELGVRLAAAVSRHLSSQQAESWHSQSWIVPSQSFGESLVRFALPIVALQGRCCHAHRQGNRAYMMRTDQWLKAPLPPWDREQARAELVRRYLRCYGPSTAEHYAEWAGIAPEQARESWTLVEPELIEVDFGGRETWLLEQERARLSSPSVATGIRLLPAHDPYLQLRDRDTLISDRALQKRIWRYVGGPGVVLSDGQCVAVWRCRKKGKMLQFAIEPIVSIRAGTRHEIEAEAVAFAPFKNCNRTEIEFGPIW